ncbi:MAG: EamA family transporter [Acidobacteriales bacterium]|nr:EamA family transporter [Terriglobales bacterium]
MTPLERQHQLRVIVAFALVYVFWGSTYLAIRVAVEGIPPALLGGVRFLIAGVLMLAYCWLTKRTVRITRREALWLFTIGVLLLTGGNLALAYSEIYVPSGLAALIVAVVPIWVALIEAFGRRGDRLGAGGWLGLILGISGLAVLLWPQIKPVLAGSEAVAASLRMQLFASAVLLLGSLSWSVGSILSRRVQLGVGPFVATGWEMTFAGLVNTLIALGLGDQHRVQWTARGVSAVVYLVIFGSWVGFTAYIWLLEHVPTPKVATYAYVNPVVAVFLGWLVLDEHIDAYIAIGTVVIVVAVALVTSSKLRRAPEPKQIPQQQLPACEAGAD